MIVKKTKNYNLTISPVEIMQLLHASLDISEILNNFIDYLKEQFIFNSLSYEHSEITKQFIYGEISKNQFTFNLSTESINLGTIIITKKTRFSKKDISQLEELMCFLIQPLKNAVTHHNVLHASLHDPLTKLLNRSSLEPSLQREIQLSKRHGSPLSLIMLDIDNFKKINDNYGHLAGDNILIKIAFIISNTIRETDYAFRIGGEEFLILLNDTSIKDAEKLAERIRTKVEQSYVTFENHKLSYTISLGISYLQPENDQQSLIKKADKAMYKAKTSGKNQVFVEQT